MKEKIIAQGAEAMIILKDDEILKKRIKKYYRIYELDERIRKLRTRSEAKIIERARKVIPVPKLIEASEKNKEIKLEFIDGLKLSENLDDFELNKQKEICKKLGELICKLHDAEIIHGDLTTSNMILKGSEIYFIDFGLAFMSSKFEDKAVDLHLLKQALEAKHFKNWEELWKEVEKGYNKSKESKIVFERMKAIEKRGRYRH
jgi:TP53 regulating kinase-like protein